MGRRASARGAPRDTAVNDDAARLHPARLAHGLQFPQGGIDRGEAPHEAALRELAEETGMTSVRIVAELPRWLTYDFPPQLATRLRGGWRRWRGQRQRWFLLHFYGDEGEICLAPRAGGVGNGAGSGSGAGGAPEGGATPPPLAAPDGSPTFPPPAAPPPAPEFDGYAWVSLSDAPGLVVPFKRDVYDVVVAEFVPVLRELEARRRA